MILKPLFSTIISSLLIYQAYAVTETKVYQYSYDSNGNAIAVERVTINTSQVLYKYSYNNLNQMVGFEDIQNQKTFGYAYYPDGRRLSKQGYRESDQEAIVFYYGHQGQLMNESYSKNNQIQKQSSYFAGLRFIDDLENHNDSHIQYPMADQHNHPATLSFAQGGSSIESYQLTDYGQLAQSNIKQTEIATQTNQLGLFNFELNPMVYGSGYYDSESNLQYMGARYYSADTQRFMAQDSYNLLNRYNYANANPVMNYDPDGHKSSFAGGLKNVAMSLLPQSKSDFIELGASGIVDYIVSGLIIGNVPSITLTVLGTAASGYISGGLGSIAKSLYDHSDIDINATLEQAAFGAIVGTAIGGIQGAMVKPHPIDEISLQKKNAKLIMNRKIVDILNRGRYARWVRSWTKAYDYANNIDEQFAVYANRKLSRSIMKKILFKHGIDSDIYGLKFKIDAFTRNGYRYYKYKLEAISDYEPESFSNYMESLKSSLIIRNVLKNDNIIPNTDNLYENYSPSKFYN